MCRMKAQFAYVKQQYGKGFFVAASRLFAQTVLLHVLLTQKKNCRRPFTVGRKKMATLKK